MLLWAIIAMISPLAQSAAVEGGNCFVTPDENELEVSATSTWNIRWSPSGRNDETESKKFFFVCSNFFNFSVICLLYPSNTRLHIYSWSNDMYHLKYGFLPRLRTNLHSDRGFYSR